MAITNLLARRDRVLGAGTKVFYEQPLNIVRGNGVYLYDAEGRKYIDMYNNVLTRTLCRPLLSSSAQLI